MEKSMIYFLLKTKEQILEYLYLCTNLSDHENSRFRIIRNKEELRTYMQEDLPSNITIEKPKMIFDTNGRYHLSANLLYKKTLYEVSFALRKDGKIDLEEDSLITELNIMGDYFKNGCLLFNNHPKKLDKANQ